MPATQELGQPLSLSVYTVTRYCLPRETDAVEPDIRPLQEYYHHRQIHWSLGETEVST